MTTRVAILDLNNGVPNLGLQSIVELIETYGSSDQASYLQSLDVQVFDVRRKKDIPDLSHDLYISSGGPGSPFDGQDSTWEAAYFHWLDRLYAHNVNTATNGGTPKDALFICHSFELMVRHFGLAQVTERRSPSFGIFPVHPTVAGQQDPVIGDAGDPFYAADFRHWQVVEADYARFAECNASLLAREKVRTHVPLERAIMAIRLGGTMLGVQFHPEASPEGMGLHFIQPEKRKHVIETYGDDTYWKMLALLEEPTTLERTYTTIIPNFLHQALKAW